MGSRKYALRLRTWENVRNSCAFLTRQFYRNLPDETGQKLEENLGWHRILQGYMALLRDSKRDEVLDDLARRLKTLEAKIDATRA